MPEILCKAGDWQVHLILTARAGGRPIQQSPGNVGSLLYLAGQCTDRFVEGHKGVDEMTRTDCRPGGNRRGA
jgi:hypothetical protein